MRIKRALVDAEGDFQSLLQHVVDVGSHCDICTAPKEAPNIPSAGASSVSMLQEQMQMDLPFLDNIPTLNIMDVCLFPPHLTQVRSRNLCEV